MVIPVDEAVAVGDAGTGGVMLVNRHRMASIGTFQGKDRHDEGVMEVGVAWGGDQAPGEKRGTLASAGARGW